MRNTHVAPLPHFMAKSKRQWVSLNEQPFVHAKAAPSSGIGKPWSWLTTALLILSSPTYNKINGTSEGNSRQLVQAAVSSFLEDEIIAMFRFHGFEQHQDVVMLKQGQLTNFCAQLAPLVSAIIDFFVELDHHLWRKSKWSHAIFQTVIPQEFRSYKFTVVRSNNFCASLWMIHILEALISWQSLLQRHQTLENSILL